jgi:hypothetical protein
VVAGRLLLLALRLAVDAQQGLGGFVSLQSLLGYLGKGYSQVGKPQSSDEGTSQPETAETRRRQGAGTAALAGCVSRMPCDSLVATDDREARHGSAPFSASTLSITKAAGEGTKKPARGSADASASMACLAPPLGALLSREMVPLTPPERRRSAPGGTRPVAAGSGRGRGVSHAARTSGCGHPVLRAGTILGFGGRGIPRSPLPSSAIRYSLDVRPSTRNGAGLPSGASSLPGHGGCPCPCGAVRSQFVAGGRPIG